MPELTVRFDPDSMAWIAEADESPSVGGLATAWLGSSTQVRVDAVTGALVSIEVRGDPAGGDGEASLRTGGAIEGTLVEGGLLRLAPDRASDIVRLALLSHGADAAQALGDPSPWWDVEVAALRARLGLGSWSRGERRPIGRAPARLVVSDAPDLDDYFGLLADQAGFEMQGEHVVSLVAAGRHLETRSEPMGQLPEGDGVVQLDPGFIPAGLLRLRDGADVRSSEAPATIALISPVAEVYSSQTESIRALLTDGDGVPIAAAPMRLGVGDGGHAAATARLVVHPSRDRSALRLLLVSSMRGRPSPALLDMRERARSAVLAARAHRLGSAALAERLWVRATQGTGHEGRPLEAWNGLPFAGEIDGWASSSALPDGEGDDVGRGIRGRR